MKVTYSKSYDRAAGYAVDIIVTDEQISVQMFHEATEADEGRQLIIDGESINEAWAGKRLVGTHPLLFVRADVEKFPSWGDRSVWTGTGRYIPDTMFPPAKHTKLWHNITAETVNSKIRPTTHFLQFIRTSPIDIGAFLLYVPLKDSKLTECAIHVLQALDGVPHILNGQPVLGPETDPMEAQRSFMPKLDINGPLFVEPNGVVTMDVALKDAKGDLLERNCDVYVEALSGYLPHQRVQIVNGRGQVRVMALQVYSGEQIKVKVGFKFWSGDAEHTVTVK